MLFSDCILDAQANKNDNRCEQKIEHVSNEIVINQFHVEEISKNLNQK